VSDERPLRPETRAVRTGRDASGSLAPAVWPSTTWSYDGLEAGEAHTRTLHGTGYYSRWGNPTVDAFERAVAELEGAEAALAFGSGMGAIATTVLALCGTGSHVVAQASCYGGTHAFLTGPCARLGIEVTWVDGAEPGAFAAAVRPGRTMLVMAETPSNPRTQIVDLAALGAIRGPYTLVDSTLATPLGQRPHDFGVSLVLHSATKGIAGANDATLGVVSGERELVDAIWSYSVLHGATASPHDAASALKGLRTLDVRLDRQCATALRLAEWLSAHPAVAATWHPGLASHPQRELARRQMRRLGSVLSLDLRGGREAASALMSRLRIARPAVTLGGPETLVSHSVSSTHGSLGPDARAAAGIGEGTIRVSVGLEAFEDLRDDLAGALG
jgi:cystathionine beta-lyase/cystathionine gamma-synthase